MNPANSASRASGKAEAQMPVVSLPIIGMIRIKGYGGLRELALQYFIPGSETARGTQTAPLDTLNSTSIPKFGNTA